MKKLTFISVFTVLIVTCFAVNVLAADFYVIPSMKKNYTPVAKSGETVSYRTGADGDLGKGVAWPNPRFTDNINGTIKDNLTGLIWLKQANYKNISGETGIVTWENAIDFCNVLESGYCELSDGSSAGDWRLPNLFELESLRDMAYYSPALSNTAGTAKWTEGNPFIGVQSSWAGNTGYAWAVYMYTGDVYYYNKTGSLYYVWPIRGGN